MCVHQWLHIVIHHIHSALNIEIDNICATPVRYWAIAVNYYLCRHCAPHSTFLHLVNVRLIAIFISFFWLWNYDKTVYWHCDIADVGSFTAEDSAFLVNFIDSLFAGNQPEFMTIMKALQYTRATTSRRELCMLLLQKKGERAVSYIIPFYIYIYILLWMITNIVLTTLIGNIIFRSWLRRYSLLF